MDVPQATAEINFILNQGATFRELIQWVTYDIDTEEETPVDLTGYLCRMKLRISPAQADIDEIIYLTTANGGTTIYIENDYDETDGIIQIYMSDEYTAAIEWGSAKFDLEVYLPDGDVYRLAQGTITVNREVTY